MIYAIVAVIVLILDQGLKYWTVSHIVLDTGEVPLINGIVHLTNVHNYGAAFSILQNTRWLLVAMTAIFCIAVIYALSEELIQTPLGRWSALLVMAGALGNGIDRLFVGYVVDMLELEFIPFPVFNIADIFVTVCGVLFCVYIVFHKNPDGDSEPAEEKKPLYKRIKRNKHAQIEEKRGGDIEMITKASVHHPRPKPQMQQKPQPRQEPKPFSPENPFAEWDGNAKTASPTSARQVVTEREYIAPKYEQFQQKNAPVREKRKTADSDNMEFNIDDILAEFKD